jgi:hypothetical protein
VVGFFQPLFISVPQSDPNPLGVMDIIDMWKIYLRNNPSIGGRYVTKFEEGSKKKAVPAIAVAGSFTPVQFTPVILPRTAQPVVMTDDSNGTMGTVPRLYKRMNCAERAKSFRFLLNHHQHQQSLAPTLSISAVTVTT